MDKIPLYKCERPTKPSQHGHAGLWFDKFCNTWRDDWSMTAKEKLEWIQTVTRTVGKREQIDAYVKRQARMIQTLGGSFGVFSTESRFVTGIGRSHPVENGFAWHPVLGTPYLPGSSIKGLLRAWSEQEADKEIQACIFGAGADASSQVGGVFFLDAIPTKPVNLEADVMTPHYAGWTPEQPPGDWRSPIPIPFLVVAEKTPFLFGFGPLNSTSDLNIVRRWLTDALQWAGGGAKTAVGYGRFSRNDEETRSLKEGFEREAEQAEAGKTLEGRWRLKLKDRTEEEVYNRVRTELEKNPLPDISERYAFACAVVTLYSDWLEKWRKKEKVNPRTHTGTKKLQKCAALLDKTLAEGD